MPKLSFAPELTYHSSIGDVNYYQFMFHWLHQEVHPMFPIPVGRPRRYILTVAEKGDKFFIQLRDEVGIEFSRGEFERAKFIESWKQFAALMNSAQ